MHITTKQKSMWFTFTIATCFLTFVAQSASAQTHRWSDVSGKHKVLARFIEFDGKKVTLINTRGKKVTIAFEKLDSKSQDLAKRLQREKPERAAIQLAGKRQERFKKWLEEVRPIEQEGKLILLNINKTEVSTHNFGHEKKLDEIRQRFGDVDDEVTWASSLGIKNANHLMTKAKGGNTHSMYRLGMGYGNAGDVIRSAWWIHKAAQSRHVDSMNSIGETYLRGKTLKQNNKYAFDWFSKASKRGHIQAKVHLINFYRNGIAVSKDVNHAFKLATECTEKGNTSAMVLLGEMYANGEGTDKNLKLAANLHLKAAQLGNANGMVNLGLSFWDGSGIPQNRSLGLYWMQKGSENGHAEVQAIINVIVAVVGVIVLNEILGSDHIEQLEAASDGQTMHEILTRRYREEAELRNLENKLDRIKNGW